MFRFVLFAAFSTILCVAAGCSPQASEQPPEIAVRVTQMDNGAAVIDFKLAAPATELSFRALPEGYRAGAWRIETPDFELVRLQTREIVRRRDGAPFDAFRLRARASEAPIRKDYRPLARYGEGGVLLYTGHFWPVREGGARMDAAFDFTPASGAKVVAFGTRVDRLTGWRSPMAHPAYVYLGPLAPVETDDVLALVDPAAPAWIVAEFETLTPVAMAWLADALGGPLATKPNLFLSAPPDGAPGRIRYSGDALPGQFQITLEGGGWGAPDARARDVFRRATIHEAVHLWQASTHPAPGEKVGWIHEGAADAVAADAMLALDYWTPDQYRDDEERARRECAAALDQGSLASAERRGDYRALYACGQAVAQAVSIASGAPAAAFWRDFIPAAAGLEEGYRTSDFMDLVEARTGHAEFRHALERFVRTRPAHGEAAVDALYAAARPPLASSGARR